MTYRRRIFRRYELFCLEVAKKLKQDPEKIGRRINHRHQWAATWTSSNVKLINAKNTGPYIQLFLNKNKSLLVGKYCKPLNLKKNTAKAGANAGKSYDWCSGPGIRKPIGVGHLRSTVIGQALANIYEATGYSVIKDNHFGRLGNAIWQAGHAISNGAIRKGRKSNQKNSIGFI